MATQEEEPRTMARVQGTVEERWPKRSYTVWVTRDNGVPVRHVAVRFGRTVFEGLGATWIEAMNHVDEQRLRAPHRARRRP